ITSPISSIIAELSNPAAKKFSSLDIPISPFCSETDFASSRMTFNPGSSTEPFLKFRIPSF
ncbi:hypothetical protein DBR28_20905, partial [Chryseobacterium sp. HMWF028]